MAQFKIPHKLTDKEAARVVLPNLGRIYRRQSGDFTNSARWAKRDRYGAPIVASDGRGKMIRPRGGFHVAELSDCGTAIGAYLEAMGLSEETADPRAIFWGEYDSWAKHDPHDGCCDVCGRGTADGAVCSHCGQWSETIVADWSQSRDVA